MDDSVTDYEAQRQANIRANREMLKSLGLLDRPLEAVTGPASAPITEKKKRKARSGVHLSSVAGLPTPSNATLGRARTSGRIQGMEPVRYADDDAVDGSTIKSRSSLSALHSVQPAMPSTVGRGRSFLLGDPFINDGVGASATKTRLEIYTVANLNALGSCDAPYDHHPARLPLNNQKKGGAAASGVRQLGKYAKVEVGEDRLTCHWCRHKSRDQKCSCAVCGDCYCGP